MRVVNFTDVALIRGRISSTKWKENFLLNFKENIAILNMKNSHFCVPTGPPLKLDKMNKEVK